MMIDNYTKVDSTITEHRAPTDESIRILNEFEEKTKANILAKIHVNQNYLQAVGFFIQDDMSQDVIELHAKFILNGIEHKIRSMIPKEDFLEAEWKGRGESISLIYEKFSQTIAEQLMKQNIEQLNKIFKLR